MMINHVEELLTIIEDGVRGKIKPHLNERHITFFEDACDAEKLRNKLKTISNINKRDVIGGNGRSLLHHAVINGYEDCVDVLLKSRLLNVNQPTLLGKDSALHLGALKSNRNIVFKLLHHGANPNLRNAYGSTPLHYTHDKQIASLLVTFGGSVTIEDCFKRKPIDYALEKGNQDLIQFFIDIEDEANAKIHINNREQIDKNSTRHHALIK
jgi:ankyrin repeat protein